MCFHSKQTKSAIEVQNRFKAQIKDVSLFHKMEDINAFTFPKTPVVADDDKEAIQFLKWGLIPKWAKDESIRDYTLNARIETIKEKPSFKGSVNNRCLIIADGFYEWQWLDPKGKKKQKYLITLPNNDLFAFGGIWSAWVDKSTGEIIKTYSIVTTQANELMAEIHNNKKRMPVILNPENEKEWLNGEEIMEFEKCDLELNALKII